MKLKSFFSKNKQCINNIPKEEKVKIIGTKSYVDIEYQDNVIRFDGELCTDGFYAIVLSGQWLRHSGSITQQEIISIVEEEVSSKKFKVFFE